MAAVAPTLSSPAAQIDRRRGFGWIRGVAIPGRIALGLFALISLVAVFAGLLEPHGTSIAAGPAFHAPSWQFPFGTDDAGRDQFSRVIAGLQTTWLSALGVIALGLLVGGTIGLIAGAAGGWTDGFLMRCTDAFLALPAAVLAIAVVAALGPSLMHTLIAVSILWWPYYARLIRTEVRALAARPFFEAALLAGTSRRRLLLRHLLPGVLPVAIVAASLDIANAITILAGLSFLGLGAAPPAAELGSMTAGGLPELLTAWWLPIIPALAIFVLCLVGNFAGDSLRDLADR
jgi:peptide/nickel transport system permease protein